MASILNNIRGKAFCSGKEFEAHVLLMTDLEYDAYLKEVQKLPKKEQKKWKRRNEKSDGSTSTIRFDGKGLYTHWLNCRVDVVSQTMMAEISSTRQVLPGLVTAHQLDNFQNSEALHNLMDQTLIQTHSGKHRPRNHPVRVPTRAGEPLRA